MRRWLHLGAGALLAATLSQAPAYHHQYLQRLGGHVDELSRQIEQLDARAARQGLDRYDYIRRFRDNPDPAVRGEGDHLLETIARHIRLSQSYDRLSRLPSYWLVPVTAFELDPPIAAAAVRDFNPALPLTADGLGHAAVGFFLGYAGLAGLVALIPGRRARKPHPQAGG